jgi:colicin import membrane protein
MRIEDAIKSNWTYPVAFNSTTNKEDLEAIIILTVRRDGKILKTWFGKKSKSPLFDDSVLKAVERSDPLPEFPPGYLKRHDEVEITFNLKDLVQ